ncbi:MAG: class A beta-lactamase-related serine hydrolase [Acetobacteraceae bacterium]|nr:class A beta-lactamase-related serine hydrolase [Acetobacteraceae bacterium]
MPNVAAIDAVLKDAVASGLAPGVTAAAANADGVIHEAAFGRRGLAGDAAMTKDTVFRIASMTKAITGAAAMQMVEQGKLSLDQPAGEILPFLANPGVLDGFDAAGEPKLRPAKGVVTLRKLLTHTSGFVYDTWNGEMNKYAAKTGHPAARTGKIEALQAPLGFDPGERWEYGIGIDIAGRMVEVAAGKNLETYFQDHIFRPLGMTDTGFVLQPRWKNRMAQVHTRGADGGLTPIDTPPPVENPEFYPGGGGLFSTSHDYLTFLRALMNGGELNGSRILKPETVALMGQNHMGALNVQKMVTYNPRMSNDCELFPGMDKKWGLSFLINTNDVPGGRSAGSLAWAGINNTYYWLDPVKRVAGVLMTQVLPFADPTVLGVLDRFEHAVYAA